MPNQGPPPPASTTTPMHYSEFRPASHLRPWLAYYWHFRVDGEAGEVEHWVPPDGGITVFFRERERLCAIVGPHVEPSRPEVRAGDVYWGARFWPGSAPSLLPIEPSSLRESGIALSAVHPGWATRMAAELHGLSDAEAAADRLDMLFDLLLPPLRPLDDAVLTGVFRILRSQGRQRIAAVAEAVNLSPSQFRRRFRQAVGLTPKELARIRRFRETAIDVVTEAGPDWVDLAAEHGYADQAHLVHEFRHLIGLAPETFRRRFRHIDHGRLFRRGENR